jgi:hypothetical protein
VEGPVVATAGAAGVAAGVAAIAAAVAGVAAIAAAVTAGVARIAARNALLDATLDVAANRHVHAVGNAHVDLAGALDIHLVGAHDRVAFLVSLAHGPVVGDVADFLARLAAIAGHALLDRHALGAADALRDRALFPRRAGNPVADRAGAGTAAAAVAAGVARVAAGIAAAVVAEGAMELAGEGFDLAAFPVPTIHAAAFRAANLLANRVAFDAAAFFGVRNANVHAHAFIVAFRDALAAGDAAGASLGDALDLASGVTFVATFRAITGLLDHVGFRDPLVAGDRAILRIAAAATDSRRGCGRRHLLLGSVGLRCIFDLHLVSAEGKSQHGRHSPSQHSKTNTLPDHAFSLCKLIADPYTGRGQIQRAGSGNLLL